MENEPLFPLNRCYISGNLVVKREPMTPNHCKYDKNGK